MDEQTEQRCILAIRQSVQSEHTMVLVTHKSSMLALVNRLIVIGQQKIILDGPRDEVLLKLKENAQKQQEASSVDRQENIGKLKSSIGPGNVQGGDV